MQQIQKYQTRPLDCWPKMKEIRREHFKETWKAQQEGGLVIMGIFEWFLALCAGFGKFANPSYGPYFTTMMRDRNEADKCFGMAESRGFKQGICSSMLCHLGQLYMGLTQRGPNNVTIKPDIILQPSACYAMYKTGQLVAEELKIPFLSIDFPTKSTKNTHAYVVGELQEAIEWIQKTTGRTFDDEKFIEAVENEWRCMVLWARTCELNKAIPAPLDLRQMWSLRIPVISARHKKETTDFYQILYDEVQDRVKNKISANGLEARRLLHMFMPPFYALHILKEPTKYGALFIGGDGAFSSMGAWEITKEGSWKACQSPEEQGITFHNRQQALDSLVDLYLNHLPASRCAIEANPREMTQMVHDWHADGVVAMMDHGCTTLSAGQEGEMLTLKKEGIPTCAYVGSNADFRYLNEDTVIRQLGIFLDGLGLTRLTTYNDGATEDG
jgi:benzoyl-CoA reductase subunit B